MPSKSATQALSHQWRQHIEDWRNSGLTQQAFCRDRNLSYHKFHYWRKKLADTPVAKKRPRSSALVPVTYQAPSPDNGLSVHLPSGISLRGIASDNLALVKQLLASLS
ncbi:MAG: hypothetical protein PVJ68_15775 [Candidatus Thiodiazotropha sp.]|jgi:hypothetical protein